MSQAFNKTGVSVWIHVFFVWILFVQWPTYKASLYTYPILTVSIHEVILVKHYNYSSMYVSQQVVPVYLYWRWEGCGYFLFRVPPSTPGPFQSSYYTSQFRQHSTIYKNTRIPSVIQHRTVFHVYLRSVWSGSETKLVSQCTGVASDIWQLFLEKYTRNRS